MKQILFQTINGNVTFPIEEGMIFSFHSTPFNSQFDVQKEDSTNAELYSKYVELFKKLETTTVTKVSLVIEDNQIFVFEQLNTINYNFRNDSTEVMSIVVQ